MSSLKLYNSQCIRYHIDDILSFFYIYFTFSMRTDSLGFRLLFRILTIRIVSIKRNEVKVEGVMPHGNRY